MKLVHERVAGDVEKLRVRLLVEDFLADGLQQVGLAQPDAAVDEQRVVGGARLIGHGHGGGVGELIVRAGDEIIEAVVGT